MILLLFLEVLKIDEDTYIFYEIEGRGPPLVLLHGWLAYGEIFKEIKDSLKKEYTVIIPDLPGHGRSSHTLDNYNIDTVAGAVVKLLDHLGIEKFYLLGHSMGGEIAVIIAGKYRERVKKLILLGAVGTEYFLKTPAGMLLVILRNSGLDAVLACTLPKEIVSYVMGATLYFQKEKVNWALLEKMAEYHFGSIKRRVATLKMTRECLFPYALDRVASGISCPVLLIWGEKDIASGVKVGISFKKLFKNPKFIILKDSGHMMFQESLPEVLRELKNFLEASSSASLMEPPFPLALNTPSM